MTGLLQERGLLLKKGTIVNSTLISAPTSTKNREKKRDPEAHSTKKGNTWHFGYKAYVGVDRDTGLAHTVKVTAANIHDVTMMAELVTGEEDTVHGDSGYLGAEKREGAVLRNRKGKKIRYKINRRPSQAKNLCQSKSQAYFHSSQGQIPIPEDKVLRSVKTDRQTEYGVCSGKSDPG